MIRYILIAVIASPFVLADLVWLGACFANPGFGERKSSFTLWLFIHVWVGAFIWQMARSMS